MDNKKFKCTTAIGLAASFLAMGAKLESVDKSDPKHMVFCFSDSEISFFVDGTTISDSTNNTVLSAVSRNNLDVWETQWANESLVVNAVKFWNAVQRLKSIIHSTDSYTKFTQS